MALAGTGLLFLWHRPRRLADALQAKSNGSFLPRRIHTAMSLDQLTDHFRKQVNSALLGLHLAYLFATLFEPEPILPHLHDPWLSKHVEADTLPTNAALFRCIGAAEETLVEEQSFEGDPANTIRSYLSGEFGRRGWDWPTHPTAWKQHFVAHYVEDLL